MTTDQTWWDRLYDPTNHDTYDHADDRAEPDEPEPEDEPVDEPADRNPPWWSVRGNRRQEDDGQDDEIEEEEDLEEEPAEPRDRPQRPGTYRRRRRTVDTRPARWRWALYNGTAAGTGWGLGLERYLNSAITSCARETNPVAGIILGLGMAAVIRIFIDSRTRYWWPPLAWFLRIPLASAVLALALYTSR
jgi:hypothetical protein